MLSLNDRECALEAGLFSDVFSSFLFPWTLSIVEPSFSSFLASISFSWREIWFLTASSPLLEGL